MELDFDKEIDALIRKEGAARTITIGEFAGLHPDADEIAAFVENAVPTGARREMIGHFAGCDMCRRTLSNAITVNSEIISTAAEGVAAPIGVEAVPWYRRLFMFPNLAYVMGGLIVLFGGFIGLSVFNSYQNSSSDVSQMRANETLPASAPAQPELSANSNSISVAANASNTSAAATNIQSTTTTTNTAPAPSATAANAAPVKDQNFTLDGVSTQPQQPALAQAPVKNEAKAADKLSEITEDRKKAAGVAAAEKESKRDEQALTAKPAPAPAGSSVKKTVPMRNDSTGARAAEADITARRVEDLPVKSRNTGTVDPNRKQVRGKTFEFRQGAWYDTTYRGQGTISVRRNTPDYRNLDSGLRGIAESFFGTVITIWNGKAYRIQ